jgi:hypothetical protein
MQGFYISFAKVAWLFCQGRVENGEEKVARWKVGFCQKNSLRRQGMIIDRYVILFLGMIAFECLIFASLIV